MDDENYENLTNSNIKIPSCFEPFYNMIILPNGSVGPCSVFGGAGGDDCTSRSLHEIWYGEIFNSYRNGLMSGNLPRFCQHCCVAVFIENRRIRRKLMRYLDKLV